MLEHKNSFRRLERRSGLTKVFYERRTTRNSTRNFHLPAKIDVAFVETECLMKSYGKGGLRIIASCGLALAALSWVAFAQQPAPVAAPTPAAEMRVGGGGATERGTSCVSSERERFLLERIELLERRLNELESRFDTTATGKASAPAVSSSQLAQPAVATPPNAVEAPQLANAPPKPNAALPTDATASQRQSAPAIKPSPLPRYAAWDKDGVKIIPYGIIIANVNYNSSPLDPGSIVGFALPKLPAGTILSNLFLPNTPQFNISPGNTVLGVDIKWPKIGKWEINGKVDLDLRGPTPLRANNLFAPLFINVYGEAKTERYRLMAGQSEDLTSPLFSNSLNTYPFSYLPGKLGFFRPQVRFETYQPIGGGFNLIYKGAIAQAIQTFQVADEVIGDQAGLPDVQSRLALGYGKPDLRDRYLRRPFELGVSGHLGKRQGTRLRLLVTERKFTTWSGDVDLSFKIGRKLRFNAEFFTGSVLGDYAGGVFQTFNPLRLVSIRATGAWAQLTYDISDKWQVNAAYGRDDPVNRDLAFAQRSLNEAGFVNFYYRITPRLWVATEISRWRTDWVNLPTGRAFRVEPAVLFFF